ncbi:MAG: D-alanyl-D-alanine dipeptidase [Candidatus Symbiobacter sp.]|nr:D-alanyl-D-alanine dipeptidase [Candidatus Symbiobacter sp.]
MSLMLIPDATRNIKIALAYATEHNFTGKVVYDGIAAKPQAWLHENAKNALYRAADHAAVMGYGLLVYDAFRPTEAQWRLWHHTPDANFVADPRRGSPHSRGVAVDLTLVDGQGVPLDMGTPFDDFTPRSFHSDRTIAAAAQRNRCVLLGIMTAAGWDFFQNEWWHYQLFTARDYPLLSDREAPQPMMTLTAKDGLAS